MRISTALMSVLFLILFSSCQLFEKEESVYTFSLEDDDYLWITKTDVASPAKLFNLNYFRNFNREKGSAYYWTDTELTDALNALMTYQHSAPKGESFEVSFLYYDGNEVKTGKKKFKIFDSEVFPCDNVGCL